MIHFLFIVFQVWYKPFITVFETKAYFAGSWPSFEACWHICLGYQLHWLMCRHLFRPPTISSKFWKARCTREPWLSPSKTWPCGPPSSGKRSRPSSLTGSRKAWRSSRRRRRSEALTSSASTRPWVRLPHLTRLVLAHLLLWSNLSPFSSKPSSIRFHQIQTR